MKASDTIKIEDVDTTEPKIKTLIATAVRSVLDDPDFGLELSDEAKKRLQEARDNRNPKTISLSELKKKYLNLKPAYNEHLES